MQNVNDKNREQAAKPQAGVVKVDRKLDVKDGRDDTASVANAGVYEHPEKQVGHEAGTLPKPNAGPHDRGKDPKNAATPSSGVHDEHKKKVAFDDRHDEADRKRL
jgi:hypothetical protein